MNPPSAAVITEQLEALAARLRARRMALRLTPVLHRLIAAGQRARNKAERA